MSRESTPLDLEREVIAVLDRVLQLGKRASTFTGSTPLLGSVPELDSMAVANVITALEDHFGFVMDDGEIDGSTFATVGSLADYVRARCSSGP